MDRLVQEFNDTVGLKQKIVVESVSKGSVSELEDAVRDSTDGKTGSDPLPDFCSAYADAAYDLWKKDKISDFRPYLTDEEYDSYISGYLEEGNFGTNAAMMIFPVAKSTEVLTLNSTAWEPFASETGASLEAVSYTHLDVYKRQMFRKVTGQTYIAYLTEVRLQKAVELLNETDDKTYVIAQKVGYQEQNYFSYVFKKRFGISPTKYRGTQNG